jgi:transposase
MAKRQFILTEQEVRDFIRAESETGDVRELKRLQAVRLYGQGQPTSEIQSVTGCSWRALMDWVRRYREEGLAGLKSQWQGQNAAKLTSEQRRDLKKRLHQYRPDQVIPAEARISRGQFWTVSDLKIVVQEWYAVTYQSDTSYRSLLHESGFSLQRPASRYRSRPDEQTVADFEAELEKK